MLVPGGPDCPDCKVKTYDGTQSQYKEAGDLTNLKSYAYQRSELESVEIFGGHTIKDRICFNGALNHHNCTSRLYPGPEFFVVTGFSNGNLSNSLFSGVMGMTVNPQSNFTSIVEYLHYYQLIMSA